MTDWKSLLNSITSKICNFKYFLLLRGHHYIVEHLHDTMALQKSYFNSFVNDCNNL